MANDGSLAIRSSPDKHSGPRLEGKAWSDETLATILEKPRRTSTAFAVLYERHYQAALPLLLPASIVHDEILMAQDALQTAV